MAMLDAMLLTFVCHTTHRCIRLKKTKIFFTEKFSGSSLFYLYSSKQVSRVMSTPEEKMGNMLSAFLVNPLCAMCMSASSAK